MLIPSRNVSGQKIEYINNLCLLSNTFHKIAEEVYTTSIEEYGEVAEGFKKGTVGSSTMPHKINPKLSKGIIANSQKLYSLSVPGYFSAARPFEADSTSYMLFDGLVEEALELMTEVLLRAEELTADLQINSKRMYENAQINKGLDNSEYIMMKIAEKIGKDKAHELVYDMAMETEIGGQNYLDVLLQNELISDLFSEMELIELLDPKSYTGSSVDLAHDFSKKAKQLSKQVRAKYE